MLLYALYVLGGLIVLSYGADRLIRSSVMIAQFYKVSPLIIGMTIVAFGTSAPEAAVSWISTFYGQEGIAVGNVVGSNLFNILVVLGVTAFISPLKVNLKIIKVEVPLVILFTALMWGLFVDGRFAYIEGTIFLALFVGFNYLQFYLSKKEKQAIVDIEVEDVSNVSPAKESIYFVFGLILLVGGSRLFVFGAEHLARALGISDVIIGLTIVGIGTSLPELAASLAAAKQNQSDMAIGNVVGSNIYNLLLVLGGSAFFADFIPMSEMFVRQDMLVLMFSTAILLPVLHTQLSMSKFEGLSFLGLYVLYTIFLVCQTLAFHVDLIWTSLIYYMSAMAVFAVAKVLLEFKSKRC